jgi:hypothetical protein
MFLSDLIIPAFGLGLQFPLLKASTDYNTLVSASEESLRKMEVEFIKNGHQTLTEFETTGPAYFRIVIEPNKLPKSRNFFIPSISPPKGSTLDIHFQLDGTDEDFSEATQLVKGFIRLLVDSLPAKPWSGLGTFESGREEKKWKSSF